MKPHRPVKTATDTTGREQRLTALAAQINIQEDADPATLATAIERYLLLDILETLADPATPPETRAAAVSAYFKWRNGDLARQRLALEQARLAAASNPPPPGAPAATPHEVTLEEQLLILDKFDEIFGIQSRPRLLQPPASVPLPHAAPEPLPASASP